MVNGQNCCSPASDENDCSCKPAKKSNKGKWLLFSFIMLVALGLGSYKLKQKQECADQINCSPSCKPAQCCPPK